jgi:ATP-dependent protease ClpP protease subunit
MGSSQVDPDLSAKRSAAGRRGAQARWANRSNHKLPDPAKSWREGVKAWRAKLPENAIKFRVENAAAATEDDAAELYIYDIISADDWWGGISATMVTEAVMAITADTINVHLNSPGGDIFEAHAIYNVLLNHPATINVLVDGLAASAASYIAQAGDSIVMASNASMMIHDTLTITVGNEADHLQVAGMLGKQSDIIAKIYADRAGGTTEEWRAAMRAETWYTADEAVEAGLATAVADSKRDEATNAADIQVYGEAALHTLPASTPAEATPPSVSAGDLDDIDVTELTKALEGAFA